jgi:hypothetical protein
MFLCQTLNAQRRTRHDGRRARSAVKTVNSAGAVSAGMFSHPSYFSNCTSMITTSPALK